MIGPKGPFCQSCGMPLSRDEQGGGTEADGGKSALYCSHCYKGGTFTEPDITFEQMKSKVKEKVKQAGFPVSLFAGTFTKNMDKLQRWQKV